MYFLENIHLIFLGGLPGVPEDDVDIKHRLEVPGLNSSSSSLEVRFVNVLSVFHFAQLSTFPVSPVLIVWTIF